MAAQGFIQQGLSIMMKGAVGVGVVVGGVQNCLFTVHGGERAVKYSRFSGVQEHEYKDGTYPIVPWLERAIIFDVKARPKLERSSTLTKDQQQVLIGVRVLHRPEFSCLARIIKDIGQDYDTRVLPSIMNEVMKTTVAQYDAKELLQKRAVVSNQIQALLQDRAREFHIILDDVSITALTYGADFSRSIEAKQVAQQDAERAKFVVQRRDEEGKAKIIEAEAEAEAASLLKNALELSGSGIIQLRKIEACGDIAETLARSRNVVYLPTGGGGGGGDSGGTNILLGINPQ